MATEEDREAAVVAASERLNSAIRRYVIASGGTPQRHNDSSLPLHLRRESKDALRELTAALSEMKDLARGSTLNINVVFDGPPGPQSGRFVEVEDDQGRGVSVGQWIDIGDGLWALRIPVSASSARRASPETT